MNNITWYLGNWLLAAIFIALIVRLVEEYDERVAWLMAGAVLLSVFIIDQDTWRKMSDKLNQGLGVVARP